MFSNPQSEPALYHLPLESDAEDVPPAVGVLPLGPDPDLQFAHPRIFVNNARAPRTHERRGAPMNAARIVYKFRGCAN